MLFRSGISDHAQAELGDIVYLELPEVGRFLAYDEVFGVVESVKAVSDLYTPVSGLVIEVNTPLIDATEKVNDDAQGEGWLMKVRLANSSELASLLDASAYEEFIKG